MKEEKRYKILFKLKDGKEVWGYGCRGDTYHLYDQLLDAENIIGGAEFIEIPNVCYENPQKKLTQIVHRSEILQITSYLLELPREEEENEE
jgi:hypothetical protein